MKRTGTRNICFFTWPNPALKLVNLLTERWDYLSINAGNLSVDVNDNAILFCITRK